MADSNQLNVALSESVTSNSGLTCIEPVSTNHVRDLICSSKIKCCALDPLHATLMTKCLPILQPVNTKIVNLSFSTALVPDLLKLAIISPTLKKTHLNHEEFKNFRPVCNHPFLSKIIERAVAFQLNDYLTVNGLNEVFQSAYKKNHSSESALLRVTNDILRAIDDNSSTILLLLDLSSAFDTVDHSILLNRLEHRFGMKDTPLNWFRSYFSNRKLCVSNRESTSSCRNLEFGVPQGSVLGPILYVLYTAPLGDILREHGVKYHLYADDTQM